MKEWTVMFYFASDNPLAPGVVSQLKALKNAGYHPEVNVVAYFDPQPPGTSAHIFDVNYINKLKDSTPHLGFAPTDPHVRNLMLDKLWGDEVNRDGKKIREVIQQLQIKPGITYAPPTPPAPFSKAGAQPLTDAAATADRDGYSEATPIESLTTFLNFCAGEYPAKHYMLFILGHGLVVGHDLFLYDEHAPKHSVSLNELGQALAGFKTQIGEAAFELVSFHCCSMSSLEVAYELQDTATFMLASQGPAFVGSWPYTQILIRLFNDLEQGAAETASDVNEMVRQMFSYVLDNNTDFMLAGYSFDLCLCDLSKLTTVEAPLRDLSAALVQGMADEMVKNCILLAHLQSPSYWQENNTDLYDFCFCLRRYCEQFGRATGHLRPYAKIHRACDRVIDALAEQSSERPDNPVCLAEFAGPDAQYSHGLSVYFPWSRPTADKTILRDYRSYKFTSTEALQPILPACALRGRKAGQPVLRFASSN